MRLLGRFFAAAQAAVEAGVSVDRLARVECLRPLQRMGEDVADDALDRLAALEARIDEEFARLMAAAGEAAQAAAAPPQEATP